MFQRKLVDLMLILKLILFLILLILPVTSNAQMVESKEEFHFPGRGVYRPVTPLPKEFSDFCEMNFEFKEGENELTVKPDGSGKIFIVLLLREGKVLPPAQSNKIAMQGAFVQAKCRDSNDYKSKISTLSSENTYNEKFFPKPLKFFDKLEFETFSKKGTSYKFSGNFLGNAKRENGVYISLEGVLFKLKDGKEISQTKIKFYRWGYL